MTSTPVAYERFADGREPPLPRPTRRNIQVAPTRGRVCDLPPLNLLYPSVTKNLASSEVCRGPRAMHPAPGSGCGLQDSTTYGGCDPTGGAEIQHPDARTACKIRDRLEFEAYQRELFSTVAPCGNLRDQRKC